MRFLNKEYYKTITVLATMVFFMSCTNEIVTTTSGLVYNDNFVIDTVYVDPVLETVEIDTVRTSSLSTYLLGTFTDPKLGALEASIVSQLVSENYPVNRTSNDTLNAITVSSEVNAVLEFPLSFVPNLEVTDEFTIDNIVGDISSSIDITVSTFTTYLEQRNEDAKTRVYYSNGKNNAGTKEDLGEETILGSTNYTVKSSYTTADSLEYSLKINLDSVYFENRLNELDTLSIDNSEDFIGFFKGLKITAEKNGSGFMLPLNLSDATLKVSYVNTTTTSDAILINPKELDFNFQGAVYGLYEHNHLNSEALNKTYVQGAGGYETSVDISHFITENSTVFQEENWMINQAKIKIYLDDIDSQTLSDFYMYGIKEDGSLLALQDYEELGVGQVNGVLTYEDTENQIHPYIEFYVTNFINEVLADGDIVTLRIKAREPSEQTGIVLSSSVPNGALLLNDSDKSPKLEVIYSKIEE